MIPTRWEKKTISNNANITGVRGARGGSRVSAAATTVLALLLVVRRPEQKERTNCVIHQQSEPAAIVIFGKN